MMATTGAASPEKENAVSAVSARGKSARKNRVLHWGESAASLFLMEGESAAVVTERERLAERLRARPDDAAAWWALLDHASTASEHATAEGRCRLYRRATQCIPKERPELYEAEAYVAIWLGFVREQASAGRATDALETLRHMRNEGIGRRNRAFYETWADCERRAGKPDQAKDALRVGLRSVPSSQRGPLEAKLAEEEPHEPTDDTATGPPRVKFDLPRRQPPRGSLEHGSNSDNDDDTGVVTLRHAGPPSAAPPADDTGVVVVSASVLDQQESAAATPPPPNAVHGEDDMDETVVVGSSLTGAKPTIRRREIEYMLKWEPTTRGGGAKAPSTRRVHMAPAVMVMAPPPPPALVGTPAGTRPEKALVSRSSVDRAPRAEPPTSAVTSGSDRSVASASTSTSTRQEEDDDNSEDSSSDEAPPPPRQHRATPASARGRHKMMMMMMAPAEGGAASSAETMSSSSMASGFVSPFADIFSERNLLSVDGQWYAKLVMIGRGGSSKVFRVLSADMQVLALKRIRLKGSDQDSLAGYENEITLLRRLRGKAGIVTLHAAQVDRSAGLIQMIMEAGEADLATVLQQRLLEDQPPSPAVPQGPHKLPPPRSHVNFVRLTWQQMLEAVHTIHEDRIVHGDLKPANFLFVQGRLKLIDFGIARAIKNDTTNIYRDTQIGTLNYMSPEAIRDSNPSGSSRASFGGTMRKPTMRLGRASDVWSLGCILYQMIYGRTPFGDLHLIPKLQAIVNPHHRIATPAAPLASPAALECVRGCLQREPNDRPPIHGPDGLLAHPFLEPTAPSVDGAKLLRSLEGALLGVSASQDHRPDAAAISRAVCDDLGIPLLAPGKTKSQQQAPPGPPPAEAEKNAQNHDVPSSHQRPPPLEAVLQSQQRQLRTVTPAARSAVPRAGGLLSVMNEGFERMPSLREDTLGDKTMDMSWH